MSPLSLREHRDEHAPLPRRWDLAGLLGGKAIFVGWVIIVPMLVYPWWAVLGGYLVYSMIVSLIMAVTFQLAHCVGEADFASAEQLAAERRIWAVHEVETTVDFCPRNAVLGWMVGSLNFQIEHHLFPRVPHTPTRRSPRSSSATPSVTVSVTSPSTRCGRPSDRTTGTFARWGETVSRSRSTWADDPPDGGELRARLRSRGEWMAQTCRVGHGESHRPWASGRPADAGGGLLRDR